MSQRVLVIGDCILDITRVGDCFRSSPECPECPVLTNQESQNDLGGAANVASWLAAAPGIFVALTGLSGIDDHSVEFRTLCHQKDISWRGLNLVSHRDLMTVKERIYRREPQNGAIRQIARLDRDSDLRLSQDGYRRIAEEIENSKLDAIVVADYGKGVFEGLWGDEAIGTVARLARKTGVPLFVNSKYPGRWWETGATVLVCNMQELERAWPEDTWHKSAPNCCYLIVTMSEYGARIFVHPSRGVPCPTVHALSMAQEVVDVTGAGDAFLAGVVYQMLSRRRGFPYDLTCEDLETILIGGHEWARWCVGQLGVGIPIGEKNQNE